MLLTISSKQHKWSSFTYTGCFKTCGHSAGGDFLGLCDQKSSYKQCPILDGYGVMTAWNLE